MGIFCHNPISSLTVTMVKHFMMILSTSSSYEREWLHLTAHWGYFPYIIKLSSFLSKSLAYIYSSFYKNYVMGHLCHSPISSLTVTMDKHFMMILSTSSAYEREWLHLTAHWGCFPYIIKLSSFLATLKYLRCPFNCILGLHNFV